MFDKYNLNIWSYIKIMTKCVFKIFFIIKCPNQKFNDNVYNSWYLIKYVNFYYEINIHIKVTVRIRYDK